MTRLEAIEALTFGDLTDEAMSLLDRAVSAVKVDSTFGPPIYIPSPFRKESQAAAQPGAPAPVAIKGKGFDVARWLKPKITFEMRKGWGKNRSFAPYGNPGTNYWGVVLAVGLGVTLLASYGGVSLARGR